MTDEANAQSDAATTGAQAGVGNINTADIVTAIKAALTTAMSDRSFQQTENVIDVGADEATMRAVVNDGHKWGANEKRTFDEYQDLGLVDARQKSEYSSRSRDHFDMMMGDNRAHTNNLRKIELELLQNGNTAAKIGDNRMWTMDTEALEAMVAVVTAKVLDTADQTS